MKALDRRLSALECASPREPLAPHLKQWLGMTLTPEEQKVADAHVFESDGDDVDYSKFSPEVRAWLQVD
tara:strand:- start:685 stop:891 length:207 start_codon:yes stop_codon:yes gene_type:complete